MSAYIFKNLLPLVPKLLLLSASGTTFSTVTLPVNSPPDLGILVAILLLTVVAKFASSPIAAANSLRVLRADGDESIKLVIAVPTKAVVATLVLLVPAD